MFIARGGRSRSIRSFGPHAITKVERNEHAGGLGDVIFAEELTDNYVGIRVGFHSRHRRQVVDVGFFGIPDAREVEAEIVKLRRAETAAEAAPA